MHFESINPLPLLMTAAMMFGIVAHDTSLERVATIAVAVPAVAVTYGSIEALANLNTQPLHTHIEQAGFNNTAGFNSAQPRVLPRDDENSNGRKRKSYASDADSEYHWPSI